MGASYRVSILPFKAIHFTNGMIDLQGKKLTIKKSRKILLFNIQDS